MNKLFQVDAFTEEPFKGNPAGVCILEEEQSETWMLDLAREMNLSETAFIQKRNNLYSLRWFTPKIEVSLCGHATLASAHILYEQSYESPNNEIKFETKSGILIAKRNEDQIELNFPARIIAKSEENRDLNKALDIAPVFTGTYRTEKGTLYLMETASEETIKKITPDFQGIISSKARGVIVTSRSSDIKYDFISRYFAPAVGINEDPVTGSAHCSLTPYWGKKLNKKHLVGFQASERSGIVNCIWNDDRVMIGGKAVTVFDIEMKMKKNT